MYLDKKELMGLQSNVYAYKINDLFSFTKFVYDGWLGSQSSPKICLHSCWMPQKLAFI